MGLELVKKKKKKGIPPHQLRGVETPATVMLSLVTFDAQFAEWWSHDKILVGGIKINKAKPTDVNEGKSTCCLRYAPVLIPRNWEEESFHVVVEYEVPDEVSNVQFKLYYGCGDPSELRLGQTEFMPGATGGKNRVKLGLLAKYLVKGELFRATLEVVRKMHGPVLIYGCWLEVGVD